MPTLNPSTPSLPPPRPRDRKAQPRLRINNLPRNGSALGVGTNRGVAGVPAGLLEKEAKEPPERLQLCEVQEASKVPGLSLTGARPAPGPGTSPLPRCPGPPAWPDSLVGEETDLPMSTKERWMGFLVWCRCFLRRT